MSSLDEDVAAILGVPSERLSSAARTGAAATSRRRIAVSGVFLLAIFGAVGLFVRFHAPVPSAVGPEARLVSPAAQHAKPPTSLSPPVAIAPPRIGEATADEPKAAAHTPSNDGPAVHASDLPPPPAPPSATTLAQIVADEAPAPPKIVTASRVRLMAAPTEKLGKPPSPHLDRQSATAAPPVWIGEPTAEDVERVYPLDAMRDGVSGSVVLSCVERTDGFVEGCHVLNERPFGAGFGRAALRLSRQFRFSPHLVDGRAVEFDVEVPYDFAVVD